MKGYNVPDLANGLEPIGDLNVRESTQATIDQAIGGEVREKGVGEDQVEHTKGVRVEGAEDANFNPLSHSIESNINLPIDMENLVNVPSNEN